MRHAWCVGILTSMNLLVMVGMLYLAWRLDRLRVLLESLGDYDEGEGEG